MPTVKEYLAEIARINPDLKVDFANLLENPDKSDQILDEER